MAITQVRRLGYGFVPVRNADAQVFTIAGSIETIGRIAGRVASKAGAGER